MNIQTILTLLNEKMSDAKIGEEIGVSQPTVTRLRNGKHKRTYQDTADALRKLAVREGVIKEDAA